MSAEAVETGPATQQRKKPIRTYGRRSATAATKEDPKPSTPRQLSPEDTPTSQLPPPNLATTVPPSVECCPKFNAPKSGSILSFFKAKPKTPAPSTSKATTPAPLASDELTSTPPSPPPSGSGQRKRRRLTTRPTFDDDAAAGDNLAGKRRKESGDETPEARDGTPINTSSAFMTETDSTARTISTQLVTQKKRTAKAPTKEMVQTTLSLAIGEPRPQFIVCKECSMLYNHLNDKDRKDHKRVHVAYIRSKNKEVE
ncbi:hypothetical protein QR685DRAFT_447400 [Neurospora intermedia]|uniref:N-acetyltransferase ESCO zinc-finger domain-containing protein n=1 Tax=Neurospora intermedia TaxID=5142 RepID=A0ABR3D5I7_NEUIN